MKLLLIIALGLTSLLLSPFASAATCPIEVLSRPVKFCSAQGRPHFTLICWADGHLAISFYMGANYATRHLPRMHTFAEPVPGKVLEFTRELTTGRPHVTTLKFQSRFTVSKEGGETQIRYESRSLTRDYENEEWRPGPWSATDANTGSCR